MRPHCPAPESQALTIDDVLGIKHPAVPAWSPRGNAIAFVWSDFGPLHLFTVNPSGGTAPRQVSRGDKRVSGFSWSPNGDLVYAQGGRLFLAEGEGEPRPLTAGGKDGFPRFSPKGDTIAFVRDGQLQILGVSSPSLITCRHPGRVDGGIHAPAFIWSPDSSRVAVAIREGDIWSVAVVHPEAGTQWQYKGAGAVSAYAWAGTGALHFTVTKDYHRLREHYIVDLASGQQKLLLTEESPRALKDDPAPQVNAAGDLILYSLPTDGWLHLYLYRLADGSLTQITKGEFEDAGHEAEVPRFSKDGKQIVWSSSRGNLVQRELWVYDVASGEQRQLTDLPGTNTDPSFSPDGSQVAFIHAGPYESADIWAIGADGSSPRQLSHSMPASWTKDKIAEPIHVTYEGVKGVMVHADVWLPKGFDPAKKYPALVFVHGGQTRQMRYGWHPMGSYALFYSFNQFLTHQGYVVCSVDYRGGTGFGQEFLQSNYLGMGIDDAADVRDSAKMLAELGYVDPARIGVWGLSYGGYMTLANLTRYPETFALGVNIAGLWDFTSWLEYWRSLYQDIHFTGRLGGPLTEETKEYYANASPRTVAHQLKKPLLNLMGTADERVDFGQMDKIVSDLTQLGKEFELMYYPGETHTFTYRHTWKDAFGRMMAFFDRHLKQ